MSMSSQDKNEFADEALRMVSAARDKDITMRIMGALVVLLHCEKYLHLHDAMKRELTDIDVMTYRKHCEQLEPFFVSLGYAPDEHILAYFGDRRHKYYNKSNGRGIDVFIDKLPMCHTIPFAGRLEEDYPTITLADFILEKMQIVQLNEKDIKDTVVILREHEVGEVDQDTVNAKHIAKTLSDDWGFYYTVTTNLGRIKTTLPTINVLSEEDRADVSAKTERLLDYIDRAPKTMKWKMRAKVGTKKKWYADVEELVR
jgi:hypothetical protein